MSINSQLTDYSLTNSQLYTASFLAKKSYKLFITIPHTDIEKEYLLDLFREYKQIIYSKICQEHHDDGDTHLHVVLAFKAQVRYKSIHDILIKASLGKRIQGAINYQIPKSMEAVSKYLDKENDICEYGEKPMVIGKGQVANNKEIGYKQAIIEAQNGNIEEAKNILLEYQPRDMLISGGNILDNLNSLNQTRKKFTVPSYNVDNTELREWQKQLLELVQSTPQERRIIWVHGEPETGKSFMFNYLSNLDNYEYGIYNAGQCVSMDNLVYGYDEEGIIAWDFPMNFQFNSDTNNLQGHIANVIEKFSDFGQTVSSKKYKGSTKVIRGHCVVFSNRPCLEELQHRTIINIRAQKEFILNKATTIVSNKAIRQDTDYAVVSNKADTIMNKAIGISNKANIIVNKAIPINDKTEQIQVCNAKINKLTQFISNYRNYNTNITDLTDPTSVLYKAKTKRVELQDKIKRLQLETQEEDEVKKQK